MPVNFITDILYRKPVLEGCNHKYKPKWYEFFRVKNFSIKFWKQKIFKINIFSVTDPSFVFTGRPLIIVLFFLVFLKLIDKLLKMPWHELYFKNSRLPICFWNISWLFFNDHYYCSIALGGWGEVETMKWSKQSVETGSVTAETGAWKIETGAFNSQASNTLKPDLPQHTLH